MSDIPPSSNRNSFSPAESIPIELIEKVVAHVAVHPVHEDCFEDIEARFQMRKDLLSAMRISRNWTNAGEKKIYEIVHIKTDKTLTFFAYLRRGDRRLELIRKLYYSQEAFTYMVEIEELETIARFKNLTFLSLRLPYPVWSEIRSVTLKLNKLRVVDIKFYDDRGLEGEKMESIVFLPSQMNSLTVGYYGMHGSPSEFRMNVLLGSSMRPNLKELNLSCTRSSEVIPLLQFLPLLESLIVGYYDREDFLPLLPASLKYLEVSHSQNLMQQLKDKRKSDVPVPFTQLKINCEEHDIEEEDFFIFEILQCIPPITELIIESLELSELAEAMGDFEIGELKFKKLTVGVFAELDKSRGDGAVENEWKSIVANFERLGIELERSSKLGERYRRHVFR